MSNYNEKNIFINVIYELLNGESFNNDLGRIIQLKLLRNTIWQWTGRNGKYDGCKIWSEKAYNLFKQNDNKKNLNLVHEHIIPIKLLLNEIINLKTKEQISLFLDKANGACILREEDSILNKNGYRSNMPENLKDKSILNYTLEDEFARYINSGIKLVNTETEELIF